MSIFLHGKRQKKELSGTRKPRFLSNGAWSIYRSGKRLLQPFYFCYRTFGLGKMAYVKLLTLICITNDPKIYYKYISNHNVVAKLFRNSFRDGTFLFVTNTRHCVLLSDNARNLNHQKTEKYKIFSFSWFKSFLAFSAWHKLAS